MDKVLLLYLSEPLFVYYSSSFNSYFKVKEYRDEFTSKVQYV
jgi:hypothetical protein